MNGLSIVIPAYNEEGRLGLTLERYLPTLESMGEPFEVIVVCDGCSDLTAKIAATYGHRHVRVLEFSTRLGKGGAIFAGMRESQYESVGFVDADGPIPATEISRLRAVLRNADCVISSRWTRGSRMDLPPPLLNRIAGRVWNALVRGLLLLPYTDTQCGAKFYRKAVINRVLSAVNLTNMAFDISLLYHIRSAGYSVQEVPVTWTHSPGSKFRLGKMIYVMSVSLVAVRFMNLPTRDWIPHELKSWFSTHCGNV